MKTTGRILKVSEKEIETKNGKRKKYGITLGEMTDDQKYIWYNGWGACKFKEGDRVGIEYEENEYGRQINDIWQLPHTNNNKKETKPKLKTTKQSTEIILRTEDVENIKINAQTSSKIMKTQYEPEERSLSITIPAKNVTVELLDNILKLQEQAILKSFKRIGKEKQLAIKELPEEEVKRIEDLVNKILGDGK